MNREQHNLMEQLSGKFFTLRGDLRKNQNRSYAETAKLGLDMYYDWYTGQLDRISNHSPEYYQTQYYSKVHRLMERIIDESSLHNTVPINIDRTKLRDMLSTQRQQDD